MGGFSSDRDWGPSGATSPRRRRHHDPEPDTFEIFTATAVLSRVSATEPAIVERAKESLYDQATAYLDRYGYLGTAMAWITDPPADATGTVTLRLEVRMVPRTDGEWPAIRAAMAEDAADRAEALAGKTTVGDRLDALKRAAAVWTSPSLTDACRSAEKAASGLSAAFQQLDRAAPRLPFRDR